MTATALKEQTTFGAPKVTANHSFNVRPWMIINKAASEVNCTDLDVDFFRDSYLQFMISDSGSMASGPGGRGPLSGLLASCGTRAPGSAAIKPLPALKDSLKNVMFYC